MFQDLTNCGGGCEAVGTSYSGSTRAEMQAALVSQIMTARRAGDTASERRLSAELLESVRPVIKKIARCIKPFAGSLALEDLEQVASMAVLRTIDKYDPTRGGQSFGEVAYFRARTACGQYARLHASDVHLSDGAHKGRTLDSDATSRGTVRVQSVDAPSPVADATRARASAVDELEVGLRVLTGRDAEGECPEALLLAAERRARVFGAVRRLSTERRELVSRVFGLNRQPQSVRSIAEAWGAPKSRVDRMLARTVVELRELLVDVES